MSENECVLIGEPLMRFAGGASEIFRTTADELFATAVRRPHYIAGVGDIETAPGFVSAGVGMIVLVDEQLARMPRRPGLRFGPLVSEVRFRLAAVWNERGPNHAAVGRFVDGTARLVKERHRDMLQPADRGAPWRSTATRYYRRSLESKKARGYGL